MKRAPLILVAMIALGGCSAGNSQPLEDQMRDMIEWSRRNPDVSEATWRDVRRLVCKPELVDVCDRQECRNRKFTSDVPVVLSWSPSNGEYKRCDPKTRECHTYHPEVSYGGPFANIVMPENAVIFRLTASGEYREIANLVNETYVYRGKCLPE